MQDPILDPKGMVVWFGMVKMTFTVDDDTARTLRQMADRLQKPQSQVLREAIRFYEPHAGLLNGEERRRRVELFDEVIARIPSGSAGKVDEELRQIRRSRRAGWRRSAPR